MRGNLPLLERAIATVSPAAASKMAVNRLRYEELNKVGAVGGDAQRPETRHRGASRIIRHMANWFPRVGSGTTDLPTYERKTLVARSFDAHRNHMVARAIVGRMRTNVIGTGLVPYPAVDAQALGISETEADTLNQIIATNWKIWADNPVECDAEATLDFGGQQSLAFLTALLAGDCFGLSPVEERPGCVFDLKVQLIDPARVSNPDGTANTESLIDGIHLTPLGAPKKVSIQRRHPDSPIGPLGWDTVDVFGPSTGRRRVMQIWNEKDRIGAVRGTPVLAAILEPLQVLEQYSRAELVAAVISAMFTVFIEKQYPNVLDERGLPVPLLPASATDTAPGTATNVELGNGAIVDLAMGEKANTANPGRPNVNYDPFFLSVVKQIGAAVELPVDELLLHYQSSYSAARAAMLQAWRMYTMRRWWMTQQFCAPYYQLWFDEAVAKGRIPVTGYADPIRRAAYCSAMWIGPARGAMDESQEAQAADQRIKTGISNLAIETAAQTGEDYRLVLAQRKREIQLLKAAEIPIEGVTGATAGTGDVAESSVDAMNAYGTGVRSGAITPQVEDETQIRADLGLPAMSEAARKAWADEDGIRRPITLRDENGNAPTPFGQPGQAPGAPGDDPEDPADPAPSDEPADEGADNA